MTTGGFGTTTEEMERAGKHVLDVNDGVQSELSTLRGKLEPLAALWTGPAAIAFGQLMIRWDTDARALNQALGSIGHAIQGSRTSYEQHEVQQAGGLSTIREALG